MRRIGQAVAQRARAFRMKIHYTNLHRLAPEFEREAVFHAGASQPPEFNSESVSKRGLGHNSASWLYGLSQIGTPVQLAPTRL